MIKAVIFDLDGLLVDTEPICYQILKDILWEFGRPFTLEEYAQGFSGKTEQANVARLIETYGIPWTEEEGLERITAMERALHGQGVALKPGARELLAYLRQGGYGVAVASSSVRERAVNLLDRQGVTDYFQQSVFAGEVERGKPAPDVFLRACEKLGEAPEDCLVLEDSGAGIQAAHAAGAPVVCVPDLKTPPPEVLALTAAVCPSLWEVIPFLEEKAGRGYYRPCREYDECNRLIADCFQTGQYEACFAGHLALAQEGYPLAECQVGYFYCDGLGVEKDPAKAFAWTRRAAEHGDRDGQYNLACFYEQGTGTVPDPGRARCWYARAAVQGHDLALAKCREAGITLDEQKG